MFTAGVIILTTTLYRLWRLVSLLLILLSTHAQAEIVEDWGTISTPLEEDLTFEVQHNDITKNFSHDYNFSLEGESDAIYELTFNFDYCRYGCGNVTTSYGIYDLNGGLISDVDSNGTLYLTSGDYSLRIDGTGFGAGNSIDYLGSITFTATAVATTNAVISSAPEPSVFGLLLAGATLYLLRNRRIKHTHKRTYRHKPVSESIEKLA